jgi:hypothetical protein
MVLPLLGGVYNFAAEGELAGQESLLMPAQEFPRFELHEARGSRVRGSAWHRKPEPSRKNRGKGGATP